MQGNGTILTIQEMALHMICLFREIFTCEIKNEDLDFVLLYNNKTAGEMLAQTLLFNDKFWDVEYKNSLKI